MADCLRSGRQPYGVQDLLVARAPAEVPGQRLPDLGVGGARVPRQQVMGLHEQPRRAEPALHRAGLEERLLHRVQRLAARPAPRR